jgi:hypothetical protein
MDEQQWTFTSTVTTPDGIRVTTTVELAPIVANPRVRADSAELAQMAASNCAKQIRKVYDEVPF